MISFVTPGLIDLRCFTVFGMSAKIHENPLGCFGTGSKHAVAILLRNRHKVTLWQGLARYEFILRNISSRGKDFNLILLRDCSTGQCTELPFTIDLGKSWEMWQAYRELHSNTLDEKGYTVEGRVEPAPDTTVITVEGDDFKQCYYQRDSIFLSTSPVATTEALHIHPGQSKYAYYRGVRVIELRRPSCYTYNLQRLVSGLTEDRTLKSPSDLDWYIVKAVEASKDCDFITSVITAPESRYEAHLCGYGEADNASEEFLTTYSNLRRAGHHTALVSWASALYLAARKVFPLPEPVGMNRIQERQLQKALDFCEKAGYDIRNSGYPIVVVPHAHGNLLALAESGRIVLTLGLFDRGINELVNGLLEEYFHLKHQLRDETREMQTFLLRQLVNQAQMATGEVL